MLFFYFAVDIISAIEFDKTGDHLATGDRGGRVVLFERTDTKEYDPFSMLEAEENWSGWTIQLVGIQSSGTRQNFKAMNQSLIISKVWRSRRKLTRFDGARQLIVRSFFCPLMIKQ
nr:serine/threonine protein phosphatase 2A 55 kDa regulatory subunit B beta isoform-like isoform X3 [Ipomoea batatas]